MKVKEILKGSGFTLRENWRRNLKRTDVPLDYFEALVAQERRKWRSMSFEAIRNFECERLINLQQKRTRVKYRNATPAGYRGSSVSCPQIGKSFKSLAGLKSHQTQTQVIQIILNH
ncbi:Hypothetical predicted protein [Octopus vulgaris]|uniref:Uncharacterized protein n=1 Tax=Octopus vulgaris TaxID=6645 RepID=A0AA36AQR2_OCTVU|nr:Hypothetical predicted protein [Octopus vulgaris]